MNIADALDRNTIFFPDNDAIVDGERRWSSPSSDATPTGSRTR